MALKGKEKERLLEFYRMMIRIRLFEEALGILYKEGTQLHSDLDGISRIQFSDTVLEKVNEIEDELIAASILKRRDSGPGA